jgi:hypothetical protein
MTKFGYFEANPTGMKIKAWKFLGNIIVFYCMLSLYFLDGTSVKETVGGEIEPGKRYRTTS